MFFIIPVGIFVVSVFAIAWVVGRKFIYLKKLSPEVVESAVPEQESFWAEFFPGLAAYFNSAQLRQYRLNFLAEFEKILRRLRLASLKFDTATNQLIHKVRRSVVHHENVMSSESAAAQAEQETKILESTNGNGGAKDWQEEEHKLIIEIAKKPKDAALYKQLGSVYVKMGGWHDAAESFKKAVELDPEDETTRNKLARVTQKLEKLPV